MARKLHSFFQRMFAYLLLLLLLVLALGLTGWVANFLANEPL